MANKIVNGELIAMTTEEEAHRRFEDASALMDEARLSVQAANEAQLQNAIFDSTIRLSSGAAIDTQAWTQQMLRELRDRARAGRALPVGAYWRTKDNTMVRLALEDLEEYSDIMLDVVNEAYGIYWAHKADIAAAITPDQLPVI